ncbi:HPr family phosphocarrier protein [Clostridium sp. AM58-1XD]|uniref:HPr family phosphocarrier protein n=1 Tax=Clostridium sp. AM58-1XD TaxID=2292307 RepID=UPI000E4A4820|nr:HPr family phosphocarrier protein [Clostridium sp. AM58-1XD]RGY99642.1 HPr family phosphocarrier protein [Clostridium sp. AM58-1XD]
MVSKNLTVVNPSGLHLRPAGVLAQTSMRYKSNIVIECGDTRVVAKNVINVMGARIKQGARIRLMCSGVDEEEALKAVSEAIESGLGENIETE